MRAWATGTRIVTARTRLLEHPKYSRWLLLVTLTGLFATTFPGTILSISIKTIAHSLHSQPGLITWVTTAPLLAAAVCTPVLGRLGDMRGHRRLYLIGLVTAGTFSLLSAAAWSAFSLIAFRTVSQIGAAAMLPSTFAMVFRAFPTAERVRASSLTVGTNASAAVFGVVVGGPLVDLIGWRPIFVIQASICAVVFVPAVLILRVDEPVEHKEPIDYAGALALAVATFALTFGVNRLGASGLAPISIGSLLVVPLAVWALVGIERRATAPLLPVHVLSSRNIWYVVAASFSLSIGWMGTFLLTPLYLQTVTGLSVGITALLVVPRAAAGALIAPVVGRLGARVGERVLVVASSFLLGATMMLMALGAAGKSIPVIAVAIALSGAAMFVALAGLASAAGHAVGQSDYGLAVSLQQTSAQIGQVIGLGLFAALAADSTTSGPFVLVFLLAAGISVISAFVALGIRRRSDMTAPAAIVAPAAAHIAPRSDQVAPR